MTPANSVNLSELIGPSFHDLYRRVIRPIVHSVPTEVNELWLKGGRGSLKSSTASIAVDRILASDPMAHAVIGRRNENEMRDSVYAQMKWAMSETGTYNEWRFIGRPMEARNLRTGQLILFKGFQDPLKLKSIKLPFGYVKVLWYEEVDQAQGPEVLRNLEQSVFRGHDKQTLSIYTFNPPKQRSNWANQETEIQYKGRMVHHSNYLESPPAWLGPRFIEKAAILKKINERAWQHEYMGEAVGTGTEVFNNIKSVTFDNDEIAAMSNIRQGLDWGYSIHPFALVRISYDAKRQTLKVFDERSGTNVTNRQLNDKVSEDWKYTYTTYADSAEPKSCDEMRDDFKWKLVNASKPKGSVRTGLEWLRDLLRIEIDPVRCPLTYKEFFGYAFVVGPDGSVRDEYPDADNHTIDAVRYACQEFILRAEQDNTVVTPLPVTQHWG